MIHAFFKRILFLRTGSMMGQKGGLQDSRFYGRGQAYSSFLNFLVRGFCLSGFPFFLGFYSKDLIISSSSFSEGVFIYYVFLGGCAFTVGYRVRLVLRAFKGLYKFSSFLGFGELTEFFLLRTRLFFVCWVAGGIFY